MLFPGDAQIENWEYALKLSRGSGANRKALREVDLYKVGHHGSRNATPRSLYRLWTADLGEKNPMVSLMSTKAGVHGKGATAVPRSTLVGALDERTQLYSTEQLKDDQYWVEVVAQLARSRSFRRVDSG
jgi:hypothetical protein